MLKSASKARWQPIAFWVMLGLIPVAHAAIGFLLAFLLYDLLGASFAKLFGGMVACLITALGLVVMVRVEKLLKRKGF